MSVKDDLKKSVPDYVKKTAEWSVFLRWLSQNEVKTRSQLKSVLNAEIKDCQAKLNKAMSDMHRGTNTRITRQCAKKLDFLKVCRDRIAKYA